MSLFDDSEKMLKLQRQLVILLLLVVLAFALMQLGAYFADLLRILAISLLLSYFVINAVDFLDRFLHNRAVAVLVVYLFLVGLIAVAGFVLIPAMVIQVNGLVSSTVDKLPELLQRVNQAFVPLQHRFHENQIDIKFNDIISNLAAQLPKPDAGAIAGRITEMAMGTMTWTVYAVSVSVVTFYMLLDGHRMKDAVIRLFPQEYRPALDLIAHDMDKSLQAFFKGQLVLGFLFGLVMLFVYVLCDVQYALLLSVFLAICEVLPVIGPPIGFAPAAIAVAVHGSSIPPANERWVQIIILTIVFMVLQQVKDSVVAPRYMGNVIGMHPVMIFIAIMVGARIDGMLGIILALPAASVLSVLLAHLPLRTKAELDQGAPSSHGQRHVPVSTSAEQTEGVGG